jgi:hypothetical protein
MLLRLLTGTFVAGMATLWLAPAHGGGSVTSKPDVGVVACFDIVETTIVTVGDNAVFSTRVRGEAGKDKPNATGNFAGAVVYASMWPTSFDSGEIGFEDERCIIALAVTFHPDFDDAADGSENSHVWHPHWVVLTKDDACGASLKVVDLPEGSKPKVAPTRPKVLLLIDSPLYPTTFTGDRVDDEIPLYLINGIQSASFDVAAAGLEVNGNLHAPLLCDSDVFKVASGALTLPGKVVPGS